MKNKQLSIIFFLSIQLFILALIVGFSDLFNINILSILSIFLCFIMTCFLFCKTTDYYIMISAMSLTLIAETLFLFFQGFPLIVLLILNTIQILYFLRNFIESEHKKENIIVRIPVVFICLTISYLVLKEKFDGIAFVFVLYITNLFLNILFTIKDIGINNLFPIGLLILFVHGSITMFLNIDSYTIVNVPFINYLNEIPFNIGTLIYIIGQIVLTCSVFTVNRRSFSKSKKDN